jgi:class 3 adenylate cyclase
MSSGIYRLTAIAIVFFLSLAFTHGQDSITHLKESAEDLHGKDKLLVLVQITELYLQEGEAKNALKFGRDARSLADNIITEDNKLISKDDYYLKPLAYLWLGVARLQSGHYLESRGLLQQSKSDAMLWDYPDIAFKAEQYLDIIENITGDTSSKQDNVFKKTFRSIGGGFQKTSTELNVNANLKLAEYYENNGNYNKAIENYRKAIANLSNLGEWARVYEIQEHIAGLYFKGGNLEEAMLAYDELEDKIDETDDTLAQRRIEEQKGLITQKIDSTIYELEESRSLAVPAIRDDQLLNDKDSVDFLKLLAEEAEQSEDYEQSLFYYKEFMEMEKRLSEEKRNQELALLEKVNEIENRDREILLLKQNEEISAFRLRQSESELREQRTFKQNLAIGLVLLAALLLALFFLYRNKRKDHRKLSVAYNDLEVTRDHLARAEKRIKALLQQQVSGAVADELLSAGDDKPVERRFVCIMFLDIRDFTPFAEKRNPEEIISYQNLVFSFMIDIVNQYGGIINQIMGDGMMATFGAPVSTGNDCLQAVESAKEIIARLDEKVKAGEIPETRIGIGLHAGYVVAGNVGTSERKQYSITGNTVILASRIEQLNKKFDSTLIISREVYEELPSDHFQAVSFSSVQVKGRSNPMEVAVLI